MKVLNVYLRNIRKSENILFEVKFTPNKYMYPILIKHSKSMSSTLYLDSDCIYVNNQYHIHKKLTFQYKIAYD